MKKFTFFLILISFISLSFSGPNGVVWEIDVAHTFVSFKVERFLVGEVEGHFRDVSGTIHFDEQHPTKLQTSISIKTGSIDTGHETRDGHLLLPVWLDGENYPEILFVSKSVELKGGDLVVTGDLTIKGITKSVEFPFVIKGPFKDPTGANTIGIQGELSVSRQDFGLNMNKSFTSGEPFIGNEVKIGIRALAMEKQ